jgi:hypothetical protein
MKDGFECAFHSATVWDVPVTNKYCAIPSVPAREEREECARRRRPTQD